MHIGKVIGCALAGAGLAAGVSIADEYQDAGFSLPREVVAAATAFEHYTRSAAELSGGFANGEAVSRGLKASASYEPTQLEEGIIAYGAIAALQDEPFVEGVERAAGRGEQRQAFAERLIEDPYAVTRIEGSDGAARRIAAALAARAAPLVSAGASVKAASYSLQRQAWSKSMVGDAQDRLAQVKTLSRERAAPSDDDDRAMMARLVDANAAPGAGDANAGITPIEAKALALAAEAVLGRAHAVDRDRLAPLFVDAGSAQCLRMAKLNLYQCVAVAGPQYEDVYCMGQHALYDTGQCVDEAVHGGAVSVAAATPRGADGMRPNYDGQTYGGPGYQPLVAHHPLRSDPD